MWRSFQVLSGLRVSAVDGDVGRVEDVLYDERDRRGVYLVVDARPWWYDRVLLVPFDLVETPGRGVASVRVILQRDRIRHASAIQRDLPLARGTLARAATGIGWHAVAWGGFVGTPDRSASPPDRSDLADRDRLPTGDRRAARDDEEPSDRALRSVRELLSYHVEARDAELGRLRDVIFGTDWSLRALVVDTGGWLFPERAIVPYDESVAVRSACHAIELDATRAQVADSPRFELTISPEELDRRLALAEARAASGRPKTPLRAAAT